MPHHKGREALWRLIVARSLLSCSSKPMRCPCAARTAWKQRLNSTPSSSPSTQHSRR